MEESFSVYYSSVCNICKLPSSATGKTRFCSGCKLVQYCSIEHQKQDWRSHKEFCKVVQFITKEMRLCHVYQHAEQFDPDDFQTWNNLRVIFIKTVEKNLKRNLKHTETQMCLFPPVCYYCHRYRPEHMFVCQCGAVMYCSKEHQSIDNKHNQICSVFRLGFNADMLRFRKQSAMIDFLHFTNICSETMDFPENMEEFLKWYPPTLTISSICISEPFSFSLTFLYVISKIFKVESNELTLHIVGAEFIEMLAVQTFPLVYHLLPHIIHLNIVLVGPGVENFDSLPLCIEESNINVSSFRMLYHEYVASPQFVPPDIVCAFNCGLCEFEMNEEKDLWKNSLSSILSFKNTIVVITSYTERESVSDLRRLLSFKCEDVDCKTIVAHKKNPFHALYPHRDWETEGVYYAHNFISVLKT